jgi:hypothetical protein
MFAAGDAGIVCHGSLEGMMEAVKLLASNPQRRKHYSDRLQRHVAAYHGLPARADELHDLIEEMIRPQCGSERAIALEVPRRSWRRTRFIDRAGWRPATG